MAPNLDESSLKYVIDHVFLPPRLPQTDDQNARNNLVLLDLIIDSLSKFATVISDTERRVIESLLTILDNAKSTFIPLQPGEGIQQDKLMEVLALLCDKETAVPLHIEAQNCGVLVTRINSRIFFELFELSPHNQAVMSTKGRLRRKFPGFAAAIDLHTFSQEEFRRTIASTLVKMSHQTAPDTRPKVNKAQQFHEEERDTVDPKVVTELLGGFLRAAGSIEKSFQLVKNTREEVLWSNCLAPWRRSPFWLLVRVTLQLSTIRLMNEGPMAQTLYKRFMVYFMGNLLELTLGHGPSWPCDVLHIMNAKLSRRILKLRMEHNVPEYGHLRSVVQKAADRLKSTWTSASASTAPDDYRDELQSLSFEADLIHNLPKLDQYIESIAGWRSCISKRDFQPTSVLVRYQQATLPAVIDASLQNLIAFEDWTTSNLSQWLKTHYREKNTCADVRKTMLRYQLAAEGTYKGDPEAQSRMILVMLELWIACDTSARTLLPLLDDYDPGFPSELLQCLLLPAKAMMARLSFIEQYLHSRRKRARFPNGSIFRDFGTSECFGNRYFANSIEHQKLLAEIQERALKERTQKEAEFVRKSEEYRNLMRLHGETKCEYITVMDDEDVPQQEHSKRCQRCRYRAQASSLQISIHEWPLPRNVQESRNVIFELRVPPSFGNWREASMFMLHKVFRSRYQSALNPTSRHALDTIAGLKSSFQAFDIRQDFGLLSEIKPHEVTHRRNKDAGHTTLQEVCLNHGPQYRYFDSRLNVFVASLDTTEELQKVCTYVLPANGLFLQQYLARPPQQPNGPTPNTVIANQADCPKNFSLSEYNSLASLSFGFRLVWKNILLQLFMPIVDFRKGETATTILQCIHQAGPELDSNVFRATHALLENKKFGSALVSGLELMLERFRKSWESPLALDTLISLTARLLALASDPDVVNACLSLLDSARCIAMDWFYTLQTKRAEEVNDHVRSEILNRTVEVALICVHTFFVNKGQLGALAQVDSIAAIFIECSVFIHDSEHLLAGNTGYHVKRLHRLWKQLSYSIQPILGHEIIENKSSCLDKALVNLWPSYDLHGSWQRCSGAADHWLLTERTQESDAQSLQVHFDLLSGTLLVNGLPLRRLPAKYEEHPMYHTLFGCAVIEVMPSQRRGMQFAAKRSYADHTLDFGMVESVIRIYAQARGHDYVLIPKAVLRGNFPCSFIDDYVHWYDLSHDRLEFRHALSPWSSTTCEWTLFRSSNGWRLQRGDACLVQVNSNSAKVLCSRLATLDDRTQIHVTYNTTNLILELEIPRLRLGFSLTSTQDFIRSRQFRHLYIDPDQTLGTLVGLRNKLMLRHVNGSRTVILPEGIVFVHRADQHVRVLVDKSTVTRYHAYRVDTILGRLIDNGSLQSKLYLCYMHALTSFCLLDPLTGLTGTEQALSILRSSAVSSQDILDSDHVELLVNIAKLTPGRKYYPAHQRVMQQVVWNYSLSPLSQHGSFYRDVMTIFDNARRAALFSPGREVELPDLNYIEPALLERDDVRASHWRATEFGAEAHTTSWDIRYSSRDVGQSSAAARNVFITTKMVCDSQSSIYRLPCHDTLSTLWSFLAQGDALVGHLQLRPSTKLEYDSEWLREPAKYLRQHWCHLHWEQYHERQQVASPVDKFSLAMWLSTVAFGGKIDMCIVRIVALIRTDSQMKELSPPAAKRFELSKGYSPTPSAISQSVHHTRRAFSHSMVSSLKRQGHESDRQFARRQQRRFQSIQDKTVNDFVARIQNTWPCRMPSIPDNVIDDSHLDIPAALRAVAPLFEEWHDNHQFRCFAEQIARVVNSKSAGLTPPPYAHIFNCIPSGTRGSISMTINDVFDTSSTPDLIMPPKLFGSKSHQLAPPRYGTRLAQVIGQMKASAVTRFEHKHAEDLNESLSHLQTRDADDAKFDPLDHQSFQTYHKDCKTYVETLYASICMCLEPQQGATIIAAIAAQTPHVSTILLLRQLNRQYWTGLSQAWKSVLVTYARAITMFQQAERVLMLLASPVELSKELLNIGQSDWDPIQYPEDLLFEVEHAILIRPAQAKVAREMRAPTTGRNAVMQLNMGEGKSSVIVPTAAASLSDGSRLVRVIVMKAQSKQMFHTLVTKLGGLLARRIYRLPFSRDLKLDERTVAVIREICEECVKNCGVLLLQPEHLLSMKLSGLDRLVSGNQAIGRSLLSLHKFLESTTRDIVDESDDIFGVKLELVYTVGSQQPVELSPSRWLLVQQVLDLVKRFAPSIAVDMAPAMEIIDAEAGEFAHLRVFDEAAWRAIAYDVTKHICEVGLDGLPISRLPAKARKTVFNYIFESSLDQEDVVAVDHPPHDSLWASTLRPKLLLLRGLFAGGVLKFAFSQKRWRVNYGLTDSRNPSVQLAVPYRAKDLPTARAEFSHPDVVLVFTCLSQYYAGLNDEDLFLTLSHLLKTDRSHVDWQEWVRDCPSLASEFRHVTSINLKDRSQCARQIYPALRKNKKAIDYFLAHIVFPKQIKSFPHKLSVSGWDIGQTKTHATTGFSGTNDSRTLLPLDVSYLDLPEQRYTNALVLEYLLQPENSVLLLPLALRASSTDPVALVSMIVDLKPPVRVILDVGAQILELDNIGVARDWLRLMNGCSRTEAVVFFGDDDELNVVDRTGRVEMLQTSPFAEQLDLCLIFLDEAHTRGTDLKLPTEYRAAVTLGPNVTKDKLTQACMRMRKLGNGQSVVFCVPYEIQTKILARVPAIDLSSILRWAITETCQDLQTSIPLWAVQGQRFLRHQRLWQELQSDGDFNHADHAEKFLEAESQSLEERYRPRDRSQTTQLRNESSSDDSNLALIQQRCVDFEEPSGMSSTFHEEQERELSPEIERERQVQRPHRAKPVPHRLHPDLNRFVVSGELARDSSAWQPAFNTLHRTTASDSLSHMQFPAGLLVTTDFARTIQAPRPGDMLDDYQRPVQWVLTASHEASSKHLIDLLMIISPWEAQNILPKVSESEFVALHVYAPRVSLCFRPLDNLDLYTIGKQSFTRIISQKCKILLNLFAGQVYFDSLDEYRQVCDFLGLAWTKTETGQLVAADGFVLARPNSNEALQTRESPVPFLRSLIANIRHNGESIDKTHMGVVLNGGLLEQEDFAT